MQLTEQHINKLKEYGIITSTLPASVLIDQLQLNTVDLNKIWKYINLIEPTSNIEDWLNDGPTPPGPTPSSDYLTFDVLTEGKIYWALNIFSESPYDPADYAKTISYSKDDGETWTEITSDVNSSSYIEVSAGDTVLLKGTNSSYGTTIFDPELLDARSCFMINPNEDKKATFNVSGNIMSLIGGDDFANLTSFTDPYVFFGLFTGCSGIIDASELLLPVTVLTEGCYSSMFDGCTSLTAAPVLPATTLAESCYGSMFIECESLTTAPVLPATTLAEGCYGSMFCDCAALTTAPTLPATTLANSCYAFMFNGCTSLTTAPELPATTLADHCYEIMFGRCTSLTTVPESIPAISLGDGSCGAMFSGCTSLTTTPELPATDLTGGIGCYKQMFDGCTSLVTAPTLPATTLANSCYAYMFRGCTSLTTAPAISTNELPEHCCEYMFQNCTSLNHVTLDIEYWGSSSTYYWLDNVSPTGTFVGSAAVIDAWDASRSRNGIPAGWTTETIQSDDSSTIDPPDSPVFG